MVHASFAAAPRSVSTAAFALAAIFCSRAVWNALTAAHILTASTADASLTASLVEIALYVLWEFLPLVVLLRTIATGATGVAASESIKGGAYLGVFDACEALEQELESGGGDEGGAMLSAGGMRTASGSFLDLDAAADGGQRAPSSPVPIGAGSLGERAPLGAADGRGGAWHSAGGGGGGLGVSGGLTMGRADGGSLGLGMSGGLMSRWALGAGGGGGLGGDGGLGGGLAHLTQLPAGSAGARGGGAFPSRMAGGYAPVSEQVGGGYAFATPSAVDSEAFEGAGGRGGLGAGALGGGSALAASGLFHGGEGGGTFASVAATPAAGGFLAAQHNAVRRSTYAPPIAHGAGW